VETIATACASTAAILCTYQLGAFPILLAGRDDQKQFYLGAMTRGIATSFAAYRAAAIRAVDRRAFGQPIIENQAIGFKLADMAVEISAARMMLYEAAKAYDAKAYDEGQE
jgi:alkylation response protein AidB-like acyl-CoA dehydrogenase